MPRCDAPIADSTLLEYWARDLADHGQADRVEEHVFGCGHCSARLQHIASLGEGLAALARQGRVQGVISRGLLNRMQRDGVHVRLYSLVPGDTVPCTVFPGDDLVVAGLRADFSAVEAVRLTVIGPGDSLFGEFDDVPVSKSGGEVFLALPASAVRQLPSMRLHLTVMSTGDTSAELGAYVLEHSRLS